VHATWFRLRLLFAQPRLAEGERWFVALLAIGALALLTVPAWASSYVVLATRDALIFAIFALSFDLLWGKAATLSLGHATFFGIGAYGLGIVTTKLGWTPLAGMAVGVGCAAALALAIGSFLIFAGVRLHFLAIMTIAVLLIISQIAVSWSSLTGGDVGILGIPGLAFDLFGRRVDLTGEATSYVACLAALVVVLVVLWLACRGNYGKLLAAIGMNELRAKTFGYATALHLLIVFVVAAIIAAFSGALYAACAGVVGPDLFSPILSLEVVLWVAIGGRGSLLGPVVACVVLTRAQQVVSSYSTTIWPLLMGTLFLALVLFLPDGLRQVGHRLLALRGLRWMRARRAAS